MNTAKLQPKTSIDWLYYHLNRFYEEVKKAREIRNTNYIIFLLKEYGKIKIGQTTSPYSKRRNTRTVFQTRRRNKVDMCFCCFETYTEEDRGRNTIIHHIIQIQNGGYDIKKNRLLVCKTCHSKIHPFLKVS